MIMRRAGISWYSVARRLLVESEDPLIKYSKIIEKIERFFGITMRVRFKKDSSMWGEIKDDGTIHVGAKLSAKDTILVLVHEAIHQAWGLPHGSITRRVNFRSYGDKDYFSELFARLIFKENVGECSKNKRTKWPFYFRDRTTEIRFYVDMPNELIEEFAQKAKEIIDAGTEGLNKLCDEYNRRLKEQYSEIDWLEFRTLTKSYLEKPVVSINWNKFKDFLEEFAAARKDLHEKYEYLDDARSVISYVTRAKHYKKVTENVKHLANQDIDCVRREVKDFLQYLKKFGKTLEELVSWLPKAENGEQPLENIYPTTLLYLYQLEHDVGQVSNLAASGLVRQAYTTMRNIVETLCLTLADDILVYNTSALWDRNNRQTAVEMFIVNPPPFSTSDMYATKLYYDLCEKNNYKAYLSELKKFLLDGMKVDGRSFERIVNKLSYPLLMALFAAIKMSGANNVVAGLNQSDIFLYDAEKILRFAQMDIQNIEIDEWLKNKLLERVHVTLHQFNKIVPPYLTPSFTVSLVDFMFSHARSEDSYLLSSMYDRFSFFVHPYYSTWNYFPFSSVLEFKIFREEFKVFKTDITRALGHYLEVLRQLIRERT